MSTLSDRKIGDRGTVTLDGVKLLSKPYLEIREIRGIKTPQHFGKWEFEVEASDGEIFTIHIGAHTREPDIALVNSLSDNQIIDLILHPIDWEIGKRSGTQLVLKEIKER